MRRETQAILVIAIHAVLASGAQTPVPSPTPEAFFRLALAYGHTEASLREAGRRELADADRNGDGRVDQRDLWDFQAAWLARRGEVTE